LLSVPALVTLNRGTIVTGPDRINASFGGSDICARNTNGDVDEMTVTKNKLNRKSRTASPRHLQLKLQNGKAAVKPTGV
jgi:hypothetical protein